MARRKMSRGTVVMHLEEATDTNQLIDFPVSSGTINVDATEY